MGLHLSVQKSLIDQLGKQEPGPTRQKTESLQVSVKLSSLQNFCLSCRCRQIKLIP